VTAHVCHNVVVICYLDIGDRKKPQESKEKKVESKITDKK